MECKSCFWEGQADFLRCAWVYVHNYYEDSSRSLMESKCSSFTYLLLPEQFRPSRIKSCPHSCTPPSSLSCSLQVLVSSESFSHWLCMSHCTWLKHVFEHSTTFCVLNVHYYCQKFYLPSYLAQQIVLLFIFFLPFSLRIVWRRNQLLFSWSEECVACVPVSGKMDGVVCHVWVKMYSKVIIKMLLIFLVKLIVWWI